MQLIPIDILDSAIETMYINIDRIIDVYEYNNRYRVTIAGSQKDIIYVITKKSYMRLLG